MTAEHLEIERKYEVEPTTALPPLSGLPKVARVELALQSNLEEAYSDTDDLALAGAGITLRRRTGGSDAGWHLKLPRGGDDRSEVAEPLSEDDGTVPAALVSQVRAWVTAPAPEAGGDVVDQSDRPPPDRREREGAGRDQ